MRRITYFVLFLILGALMGLFELGLWLACFAVPDGWHYLKREWQTATELAGSHQGKGE